MQSENTAWIIDDHKLFGGGMRRLVLSMDKIDQAFCFSNPNEAETHARLNNTLPSLIVTDLYIPGFTICDWIKGFKTKNPEVRCAVITSSISTSDKKSCLEAGADIYFQKHQDPESVLEGLNALLSDDYTASAEETGSNEDHTPDYMGGHHLTNRQIDILVLLARGHSAKEIARLLGISYETVKTHLSNIYQELDVSGRSAASAWAREHGFV